MGSEPCVSRFAEAQSAPPPGAWAILRALLSHALPVLVAQLSSIGMMVVDTALLGHVSAADLAAVAIGGGIHVSIVFGLVGILQAVAPVVAHLHGAQRDREVAGVLQQGFWLALLLCIPGCLLLLWPDWLIRGAGMDELVEAKVRAYLALLAWGLPAALFYRTFYAFCNALGAPRVLMLIGVGSLGVHTLLAWGLAVSGWVPGVSGVEGCALSNIVIAWGACMLAGVYLARSTLAARFHPFAQWQGPRWRTWRELLRLGLPMGMSNLIEITAFTLVALFVASLGASVVAGHRIVANLSALTYMLPLSLGIAAMAAIGRAVGGRNLALARLTVRVSLYFSAGAALIIGGVLWWWTQALVQAYTNDPQVAEIAAALVIYIAIYQFFDALQTLAAHALRAYRVTFLPMLAQIVCFWGVGLLGGAWLCYWSPAPMGVAGFWLASVISLVILAAMLLPMLWKVMQATESTP